MHVAWPARCCVRFTMRPTRAYLRTILILPLSVPIILQQRSAQKKSHIPVTQGAHTQPDSKCMWAARCCVQLRTTCIPHPTPSAHSATAVALALHAHGPHAAASDCGHHSPVPFCNNGRSRPTCTRSPSHTSLPSSLLGSGENGLGRVACVGIRWTFTRRGG